MNADDILALARQLQCEPPETAIAFARMVADQCAEIADECPPGATATDAARAIRTAFHVDLGPQGVGGP